MDLSVRFMKSLHNPTWRHFPCGRGRKSDKWEGWSYKVTLKDESKLWRSVCVISNFTMSCQFLTLMRTQLLRLKKKIESLFSESSTLFSYSWPPPMGVRPHSSWTPLNRNSRCAPTHQGANEKLLIQKQHMQAAEVFFSHLVYTK